MSETQSAIQNKALENFVNDVYAYIKKKAKLQIIKWDTNKKVQILYKQINKVKLVKTLWQVDKAVDLSSFYCDSHLIIDGIRKKILRLSDLPIDRNILITGIAGQGKSIFLRYLCGKTLAEGKMVPVFIELRKIQINESLIEYIINFLNILKIKADNDIFEYFSEKGKIVLFLDGFDEIMDDIRSSVIRDIENLTLKYEKLRIIVTSRPEGGLEMLSSFEIIKLDNLLETEYQVVINKLLDDKKTAKNLIKQIEVNKSSVEELLVTPLLVTLLVMTYKTYQEIPDQLSDFYESIFQILLQRHDGAKPGYKRTRKCKLNDKQFRDLFENLSYQLKKFSKSIFLYAELYDIIKDIFKKNGIVENPDDFLCDIIKITCLILKEGSEYRFIHKSVQEYYASSYIRKKPEIIAKQFYESCAQLYSNSYFSQELKFLKEIDSYRYNKFYLIPLYCHFLNFSGGITKSCPKVDVSFIKQWIDIPYIDVLIAENKVIRIGYNFYSDILKALGDYPIHSKIIGDISKFVANKSFPIDAFYNQTFSTSKGTSVSYKFTLDEIINYEVVSEYLINEFTIIVQEVYDKLLELKISIKKFEVSDIILPI